MINFFDYQPHNNADHYAFYWSSSQEATSLATLPSFAELHPALQMLVCHFANATLRTNQLISSSFLCMFPTVDSLTLNSGPAAQSLSNAHYFLCEAHPSLPVLRTLHSASALCVRSCSAEKKHQ